MDYATWVASIQALGVGEPTATRPAATTWPFAGGTLNQPAVRFTALDYATLHSTGALDGLMAQTTNDGVYVYVLYDDIVNQPHTMTVFESLQNGGFAFGDKAAGALGLPSLTTIEHTLMLGALVIGGYVVLKLIGAGKDAAR